MELEKKFQAHFSGAYYRLFFFNRRAQKLSTRLIVDGLFRVGRERMRRALNFYELDEEVWKAERIRRSHFGASILMARGGIS